MSVQNLKRMSPHKYTPAEVRFLERNVPGCSYAEIQRLFNERFGFELTRGQLTSQMQKLGLKTGTDGRFGHGRICPKGVYPPHLKKYHESHTNYKSKPVGSEFVNHRGITFVKISDPPVWKPKHLVIWEKANGPVPKDHVVIFADMDKTNIALENLILVSKKERLIMNLYDLILPDKELTKTGKAIAELQLLIAQRKRETKKDKKPGAANLLIGKNGRANER
jgi:hypothetical protein